MEAPTTSYDRVITFDSFIFMPKGTTKTHREVKSGTISRNLRSRRNHSNRMTEPADTSGMEDQRRSSQSNRNYMFINQDVARSTSNELIRVHVMRESHRARRQLRGLMQNNEAQGQMTIFSSAPPSPRPARRQAASRAGGQDSAEQSPRRDLEDSTTQLTDPSTDKQRLKQLAQDRLSTVLSTTSAAISAASHGFQFLASLPNNIVDLCEDDLGALHALLALITSVQTSVGTLQAAEYESSALEFLRTRLAESSSADHSDETIITVLLLSRLERSRMNEETAGFHEAALMRMIRDRGGLESLAIANESLVKLLRDYDLGAGEVNIT